jgi:hypothetical protein
VIVDLEELPQFHEGAHDEDVHLDGSLTVQHRREHRDTLLGEGKRPASAPTAPGA